MLVKFGLKFWGCSNTQNTPSYGQAAECTSKQRLFIPDLLLLNVSLTYRALADCLWSKPWVKKSCLNPYLTFDWLSESRQPGGRHFEFVDNGVDNVELDVISDCISTLWKSQCPCIK